MKKLLIIALMATGLNLLAQSSLPSRNQERIYKEELAFIDTLPKDASDEELTQRYRLHLASQWYEIEPDGTIKRDADGKPIIKQVTVTTKDDDHVYYEHLNALLGMKKSFANFKRWLQQQVDGINFVRVLEPTSGQ